MNRRVIVRTCPRFSGEETLKYYTMYYAKQKIYETPQLSLQCVLAETGFAASDGSLMNSTDGVDDSEKWTFGE